MKEIYTKNFIDESGQENTLTIEGSNVNIADNRKYKLQSTLKDKKKFKKKGVLTSDIGVHSNGFAGIMGLALILSIAGAIIAYIIFKF